MSLRIAKKAARRILFEEAKRAETEEGLREWEERVERPPAVLPETVRAALTPGKTFYWQVEALSPEGMELTSAPTRFTVRAG